MRKILSPYEDENGPVAYAVVDENGDGICKTNSYAIACQALTDDDVFDYSSEWFRLRLDELGAIVE